MRISNEEDGAVASAGGINSQVWQLKFMMVLGGDANVTSVDYCATRLRVEVKDMDTVDQKKIKDTGVPGINVVGPQSIQVIVGTNVQFVADEIEKIRK